MKTDYTTLSTELDTILAKLQDPAIDVEEAVDLYERGMKLIVRLEKHLAQAENKLTRIKLSKAEST